MTTYINNLQKQTVENNNFRQVLFTGNHAQLVVMSLKPGEEIGLEVHSDVDQFFRVEQGEGLFVIGSEEYKIEDDFAFIVPAGTQHNVINTSETDDLKLYTIYSPPQHPDGTIHKDKAEADKYEHSHEH